LLAILLALGLVAAACGDDDTDTTAADDSADVATDDGTADEAADGEAADEAAGDAADEAATDGATGAEDGGAAGAPNLADVCPDPIVMQTDWFPESEHGALYELVGDDYTVDADAKSVSGSLVAGEVDTGVDIEIRAGGPAIGFQPVATQLYTDTDITLGYVSSDEAILFADDAPTIAVVAPLEKNPQIIQWDPATYPDVETIADLGEQDVLINVFAGGTFIEVFVNEGVLSADQIDPSYDGSPARFISEGGAIAQQGFASESPYSYENVYEEWAKPIAFQLIHDAGLEVYSQPLAVRADDLETLAPCLELLVPVVQQAVVDFVTDPAATNALIVETVETLDDFWEYPADLAEYSVEAQIEYGLVGNGPDATVGNLEPDRVQGVIDQMTAAGLDVTEGLTADDIVSNEFIDESIGFTD
jgi:hypothetical protein